VQDKIFYTGCFGFLLGVLLRSFVFVNLYLILWLGLISLAIILFNVFISKNKWGILVGVLVLTFTLGIFRFNMADIPNLAVFESHVGQKVNFKGEIIDEPSVGESNQKLIIEVGDKNAKTKILISAGLDTDYKYGDEINFTGTLKKPENFITDQGKEFDYVNYLKKDGILYVISYAKIEILSRGNGNKIKSWLFDAKEKFLEKMNFAISTPENLFMGGLILGEKASFSPELRKSFVNTGTIHVIALSGYNVTIVAEWIMKLFAQISLVSKNFGIGMGILVIILFIIMTGGSSTAIRAGVMSVLALIARATGRNYDVARALILAGVVMVLLNPLLLVFDVSFQLSFLATVAVIFLSPRIEKYFMWVPKTFQLRDVVSVTAAAYIFVFPFILYKMGNFSLVAIPANFLILPFIPFTMLLGFVTGFAGLVWYGLAVPTGFISYLFLHYELFVINFFAKLPFVSFTFPDFPLLLTIVIYLYFIYRLFGRNIKQFFESTSF
jgi:competence protein ComEC